MKQETFTDIEYSFRKKKTKDYLKNPHVRDGYYNLTSLLAEMGLAYGTYLWDPQCKGLDDYVWHCCKAKKL